MYNPAYLTLSRHNVYYFRYRLAQSELESSPPPYMKLSLKTRNPKEALRLANMLTYHMGQTDLKALTQRMNYLEAKQIITAYFSNLLAQKKALIDQEGPLSKDALGTIKNTLETMRAKKGETPELKKYEINSGYARHVLETLKIPIPQDPTALKRLDRLFRPAAISYAKAILAHNRSARTFDFTPPSTAIMQDDDTIKLDHLEDVIDKYIAEMDVAASWGIRAKEERISCFAYLMELLGKDFIFSQMNGSKARYVKECLSRTPSNRNKIEATRDLPLLQQIEVSGLETLSVGSINKYLQCYKTLYGWAVRNNYITKNPFEGLDIKEGNKNKKKRDMFKPEQTSAMIAELDKGKDGLANTDMKYWGTLIGLYTGARLNEIASLTPNDLKKDETTGIWYFDINEEDEKKHLKTAAATRRIPVHSELIKRGFIAYVAQVKQNATADTRILPNLSYSAKEGWGRKLTRWFSDIYLPHLDLKTDRTSFHSLRHTAITTMRQSGVDNHIVRALVGHEAEGVTEQVYNHNYTLPQLHNAIEKLQF